MVGSVSHVPTGGRGRESCVTVAIFACRNEIYFLLCHHPQFHMHPPEPDSSPLRVDVIYGWPLQSTACIFTPVSVR